MAKKLIKKVQSSENEQETVDAVIEKAFEEKLNSDAFENVDSPVSNDGLSFDSDNANTSPVVKDASSIIDVNNVDDEDKYLNERIKKASSFKQIYDGDRLLLADMNGFKLYTNTIYKVVGKLDTSAPNGYIERGIAAAPIPGNATLAQCPYNSDANVYDTGFYSQSQCYEGMSREEQREESMRRRVNICIPYETKSQVDLIQNNTDFWDTYMSKIYDGKVYNTNNIKDRMELYIAIHSCMLTPKELDGDPRFMFSYYCVEDQKNAIGTAKRRAIEKSKAIALFNSSIMSTPKERQYALDIALYLDIIYRDDMTDSDTYIYQFQLWLDNDGLNAEKYMETYERYKKGTNKDVPEMYRILHFLVEKGRVQTTQDGLFFDGMPLGINKKSAALAIAQDTNLTDTKVKMMEAYTMAMETERKYLKK